MWDNVGVVRTPSKLELAVSELSAIRTEADQLWNNSNGGAGWEVVALRDAAHSGLAVAESALANRVSGGAHYVVLEEETENEGSDDEEPIIVGLWEGVDPLEESLHSMIGVEGWEGDQQINYWILKFDLRIWSTDCTPYDNV